MTFVDRKVGRLLPPRYEGVSRLEHARGDVSASSNDGATCHIVVEGVFASVQSLPNGAKQIVGYHLPGSICGLAAVTGLPQGLGVRALSPSVSLPIGADGLVRLTATSPTWRHALFRAVCIETAIARRWLANAGQFSALHRIAHHICELEARLSAAGLCRGTSFRWWGKQADLGAATGLSLVHVNKTLRALREHGLVEWGPTIRILDLARLRSFAEFDAAYLCLDEPRLGHLLLPHFAPDAASNGGAGCGERRGISGSVVHSRP